MGSLENRYDDEYPPLCRSESGVQTDHSLRNTDETQVIDSYERKTLNIPERSLPENFNEFYHNVMRDVKQYGATIVVARMPSGSYNLDVKCPSRNMKDVIGIIRLLVERKVTKDIVLQPSIMEKLIMDSKDTLGSITSLFNGRLTYAIEDNTLYLNGVTKEVDEALEILQEKIEKLRSFEQRTIDDIHPKYFALIKGPFDENLKSILSGCKNPVSVVFPSQDSDSKSIKVSGSNSDVDHVCSCIISKYKEVSDYKETAIPLSLQFRDNIIRVNGIDKLLKDTGVSVYVSPDKTDNKIYLIGHDDDFAEAIPVVLNRAKNYDVREISCPVWLYKTLKDMPEFDITNLKKEHKELWSSYFSSKELIIFDGPSLIVKKLAAKFSTKIAEIRNAYSFKLIPYPAIFLNYIKLKGVKELNEKLAANNCCVDLGEAANQSKVLPFNSCLQLQLSGDKSEIDEAYKLVTDFITTLKQNFSLDVEFESGYLPHIENICVNNSILDELKSKCGSLVKAVLRTPRVKRQNYLALFGMKGAVFSAELYFNELVDKVQETYTVKELSIPKTYHYLIIGRGGTTRNRIIEESGIEKLLVPSADYNGPDANIITIFGEKSTVEIAESMIMEVCNISVELDEVEISISKVLANQLKLLNSLVLRKLIQNSTKNLKEFGGPGDVAVLFTTDEGTVSNLKIRGPKKLVDAVSVELTRLSKTGLHTELLSVEETYFKSIIGKNGVNMQKLTGNLNASLVIPSINQIQGKSNDKIVIMANYKGDLQKLRDSVLKFIQELKDVKEVRFKVLSKYTRKFTMRNGNEESLFQQYSSNYPSVKIQLPREGESDEIVLRGPSAFVSKLQKDILNQVNYWEKMVTETISISSDHLSFTRKQDKNIVNTLSEKHKVVIKVKKEKDVTAEDLDEVTDRLQIIVEGLPSNVEAIKKFFEESKPIQDEMKVHKRHHSSIIGSKGAGLKKLLDGLNISLKFPPNDDISDIISITGPASHVQTFKKRLEPLLKDMIKRQSDWEQRNHMVELDIDTKWYSKLIGKGGSFITSLKNKYDVNIYIPGVGNNSNVVLLDHKFVTIRGEMSKINLAKKRIEELVDEWECTEEEVIQVPKEFHGRLRGARSVNIKNLQKKHHVEVRFAPQGDLSDNSVYVKGRKENVQAAIEELNDLAAAFMHADEEDDTDTNERYTIDKFQFSKRNAAGTSNTNQGKMENYNHGLKTLQEIYGHEKVDMEPKTETRREGDPSKKAVESSERIMDLI